MPVSPDAAYDLARKVAELYEAAEQALMRLVRRSLADGLGEPTWARAKMAALGDLRRAAREVADTLERDASTAIRQAVVTAYQRGQQAAVAELGALAEGLRHAAQHALPNAPALDRLAASAVADMRPVYLRITRAVEDAYRHVITRASASSVLGVLSRRQAAQAALDDFARQGITGFVDKAGRRWQMASYAEMAVRTVTGRAAVEGHTDRLQALGLGYVIISDAPLECPRCRPWEGRVLSIDGAPGPRQVSMEHATTDGEAVPVDVAGSLAEARAEGLFHPNCRHSASAYLPGVTQRPVAPPHPGGATYADTQQQRYLERQVRAWKRRAEVALDDTSRRAATAKVRAYQARIRELTAEKQLQRQPAREQIGRAR